MSFFRHSVPILFTSIFAFKFPITFKSMLALVQAIVWILWILIHFFPCAKFKLIHTSFQHPIFCQWHDSFVWRQRATNKQITTTILQIPKKKRETEKPPRTECVWGNVCVFVWQNAMSNSNPHSTLVCMNQMKWNK